MSEQLDGRFAVLTKGGERIPIAQIAPVFAVSLPGADRDASLAVQCTVFRILTPSGEVFTLPVHEIRAIHSLTAELVEKLQNAAEGDGDDEGDPDAEQRPFGLAAFAALPKLPPMPSLPPSPAPEHPIE